jgi:hypothetical protein
MKGKYRGIIITVSFCFLALLIISGINSKNSKIRIFESKNDQVADLATSSIDRVNKSVITLPEDNILVSLVDGKGSYESKIQNMNGLVSLRNELGKIQFIRGIYGKREARLDVVVPMYISTDSYGGSMYLVLFQDRGDVAIEKSYARLGGKNIILGNIEILPGDDDKIEYKVKLVYKSEGLDKSLKNIVSKQKELIIPVIDGHFDPGGTVSK